MALTQVRGSVLPDELTLRPGMIMMWAGAQNQVPTGWQLCDGKGTTSNGIAIPNLLNRMIIGSGDTYRTGNTGGSTSVSSSSAGDHNHGVTVDSGGSHSHSVTVNSRSLSISQIPSHNHTQKTKNGFNDGYPSVNTGNSGGGGTYNQDLPTKYSGGGSTHNHSASSGSAGGHSHSASTGTTGAHSHTVAVMPPYYALAYIIKL